MSEIAIIGAGNIGEALIAGLVESGTDPSTITATNRSSERSSFLSETYGVKTTSNNAQAARTAKYVFVCVKPPYVIDMLRELSDDLDSDETSVVVSMAAGVSLEAMEDALEAGTPVVRVMPNTPMLVGKGMSACARGRYVNDNQMEGVSSLLSSVGEVIVVDEGQMDAVTALSGSAPAYFFLVTEALVDAGVQLGLKRDVATVLAKQAAAGAGALLSQSDEGPAELRAKVSSPAGTTVAALRELEESGIRGAFYRAAEACANRSQELG